MLKKVLCLICVLAMTLSAAGCSKTGTSSGNDSDVEIGGFMDFQAGTTDNSSTGNQAGTVQTPAGQVTSTSGGGVAVQIEKPDEPKEGKSILANKNYGGQEFKFLYWYTPDESVNRMVAAFNKKHNAKVKIEIVNKDYPVAMAESIAAGKPYDIIAAHGNYFPHTIFDGIYEELESYITQEDMYNSNNYKGGGLSQVVNDRFAFNGHYYALGSHKSVYLPLIYYNKKMFKDAGLEDPWELYKKGQWTWEKIQEQAKQVYDKASDISYWSIYNLAAMNRMNNVSGITFENGVYKENLTSDRMIQSAKLFQETYHSTTNPIGIVQEGDPFMSGRVYLNANTTDSYTFYAKQAKTSNKFERTADNLGTVPVPFGPLNTEKVYASAAAQGYASTKGAKDPSVAACIALFESRYTDTAKKNRVPQEVLDAVQQAFAKNGWCDYSGFEDSAGTSYNSVMDEISATIQSGGDVTSALTSKRQIIQNCIKNSTQGK